MNVITRYARNKEGEHIAYQVFGKGPVDLVFIPDWVGNLEVMREEPTLARFLDRLASFARVICFDKRGTGLSDPVPLGAVPSWEEWMYDVGAVMDAAGSESAAIVAHGEGGQMGLLFAATNPGRTTALVLIDTYARRSRAPDYPCGIPEEAANRMIGLVIGTWGTGQIVTYGASSLAGDPATIACRGRYERLAMSPGEFRTLYPRTYDLDFRSVLPSIRTPTLVLHRKDNIYVTVANGQYLAEHIDGAEFIELPGGDHLFHAGNTEAMLGPVEKFLTGEQAVPEDDRVLATVLFTDIVDATGQAERLGDRAWKDLLERHHRVVRGELARFRGEEIDTAGDGFFASFQGPARGVRCALAIRDALAQANISIRAGLHTCECELIANKIGGIAVHTGARIMGEADAGQVLVSRTVRDLVAGTDLEFESIGSRPLKGLSGGWELFAAR
jgi:pimeloyl-ACP methyl ester carboxylesterase